MRILLLFLAILSACRSDNSSSYAPTVHVSDSSIIRLDYNDVLAGSAYRRRATGYQLVVQKDSSEFIPSISESNNGNVYIRLRFGPSLTYRKQMDQFRTILTSAKEEYNLDSLKGVDLGRLVHTNELVVEITQEYLSTFGGYGSTATSNYDSIAHFLTHSKLGRDLNDIFQPYGLKVTGMSVEKVFFTNIDYSWMTDSASFDEGKFPKRLLDCMTWAKIGKIQN